MDQLDFLQLLKPVEVEPVPLTPWDKMKAGMQDVSWPEEKARILNERKKTMDETQPHTLDCNG